MRTTFTFITSGKPHVVAAALAHGREHIIPGMFCSVLRELGVGEQHAPLSLRLLESLCDNDRERIGEERAAAEMAIAARLRFWDGVAAAIEGGRHRVRKPRHSAICVGD